MLRPFRFGITLRGPIHQAAVVERARTAEALGFDVLLIPDHLLDQVSPLIALAAAAAVTTRVRLGTFVLNNDLRHPAVLAHELTTLDHLSNGRLEIGIGGGWNRPEYHMAGIPFDSARVRTARLTESLQVLKGLYGDGAFSFDGEYYSITAPEERPRPVQRPHPPILIGAGGRRSLEIAAREAQIVGLAPRMPRVGRAEILDCMADGTAEKIEWIRAAAGPRFEEFELNTYPPFDPVTITDNPLAHARESVQRLENAFGVSISPETFLESPHVFIGTLRQLEEKILWLRERFGISYITIYGDPHALAPLISRFTA